MRRNPLKLLYQLFLCCIFSLRKVRATRGGSGSGSGVEPIDVRLRELITTEVTRDILDVTSTIFGTVKEGIMDIMEERLMLL